MKNINSTGKGIMAYSEQELLPIDQIKSELHALCAGSRSGDLCLFTEEKHTVVISLNEGNIVGLRYRVTRGMNALTQIASIARATIRFEENVFSAPQTIATKIPSTQKVLQALGIDLDGGDVNKNGANKKILVVEDSRTQRVIICRMLKQNGYDVVEAADGYEALGQLDKEKPDLILLDIIMPGIDGYKVMSLIKEKPGMKNIPIIMLTSRDNLIDKMRGKVSGTNEYLTKPFVYEELIAKVDKYLYVDNNDTLQNSKA